MIETISHNFEFYPKFQSEGFAAKFAIPYAMQVCKGMGYDIGCNRVEWSLPGSIPVDPLITDFNAYELPFGEVDYIFSSHCLEHLPNWVEALDYWHKKLRIGGVVFLYLPEFSQTYWRPWNNRKHIHCLTPSIVEAYFEDQYTMWKNIFVSGVDLNNSFMIMAEKCELDY